MNYFELNRVKIFVKEATDSPDGAFCFMNSADGECRLCGGPLSYRIRTPNHTNYEARTVYRLKDNSFWTSKYKQICRNALCKAATKIFPDCFGSKKYYPMACILIELTKNGDRSDKIRMLNNATNECIQSNYKSANRKEKCKTIC